MKPKALNMSVMPEYREKMTDARSSVELNNDKIAIVFFEVVKNRLQHVNSWPIIAENLSANFQLTNKEGIEVYRKAQEGDFVKIVVSDPEGKSMSSSDWVRIQSLVELSADEGIESFGFTLAKSDGPASERRDGGPHSNDGICKFVVARTGNVVTASILEMEKTSENNHASRNNNAFTAIERFSYINWQRMADGLVSR